MYKNFKIKQKSSYSNISKIMRLSVLLSIVFVFSLSASSYSQTFRLTIDKNNVTIAEIFSDIEAMSEFSFLFSSKEVDVDKRVSVKFQNALITDILSVILTDKEITYRITDRHIILYKADPLIEITNFAAQGIAITGIVSDTEGNTLPGVNVVIKGTQQGTVTNANGAFSITVPDENATLVFSSLGYGSQEILVGNQRAMNVTLSEDVREIEEVVVVGYGTIKKENLTGAVDQIRGTALENRATVSALHALQGMVANLNITNSSGEPNAQPAINIRGFTGFGTSGTTGQSGAPLCIIDGIQTTYLGEINPNDIESISVLKDAASSAIYGSNAPYGVIIITTKKGRLETAPKITYSNNFGFSQHINTPKSVNSLYFAETINEAAVNAGRAPLFRPETIQNIKDYMAGNLKEEVTGPFPGYDEWGSWWEANANNDWFKIYFKDFSFAQQHNIGVSGGTKNSTYYIGLGYNQKNGMYNYFDDTYQRFNIRTNLSSYLTNWLTFNLRGAFSRGLNDKPSSHSTSTDVYNAYINTWPTQPFRNPDGNFNHGAQLLGVLEGGRTKTTSDRAAITGEFVVTPLRGWDITVNYSFDGALNNTQAHKRTVYWTSYSGQKRVFSGTSPNSFRRSNERSDQQVINAFTSYEKNLGGHYFKVMAGYTQTLYDYLTYAASNQYLYSDDIPSLSTTYGQKPTISDDAYQRSDRGVFGRINYGFREKYLFEFNARYDGSSKFLKDVRFKFYPGVSAAWVASKEEFWAPLNNIVNVLKIRASYGSLGDQSPFGNYDFFPSMGTTSTSSTSNNWLFSGDKMAYVSYPSIVNDQLTWITSTTFDVGLDIEVLKNRLSATFDWYVRRADKFVGPSDPLPAVLGAGAPPANNASMETRGIDLTVTWRDRIGDFAYSARATLSDYQGKVIKYPNNPNGLLSSWIPGQKMGELWGYETYGIFQSQEEIDEAPSQRLLNGAAWTPGDMRYVDRDLDGKISWGDGTISNTGDHFIIGNRTPRFAYGLALDANYKGFDFSIFLQGVAKRDEYFPYTSVAFWGITNSEWNSNVFEQHRDRWTPDNPNGYYPKYYLTGGLCEKNTATQTRYLQNAAYMRIKNMQIGYSLPKVWIDKIKFEQVRLFVNVENLATITKLISTIDPELSSNSRGYGYPLQRTWSCGVNVKF